MRAHEKPLVSVIVPMYNVENYLIECLNSLAKQTYGIQNIEVLVIDDCGQDGSAALAESHIPLLEKHSRLIKHDKNKGLGGARNTGIENASGIYIMFLDSDDYLDIDVIESLVSSMITNKTDIAIFNMNCFSEINRNYPLNPSFELFRRFENNHTIFRYEYPKFPELAHSFSACNKLFKTILFTPEMRFPEKQDYEDALLVMKILISANSISLVKDAYYNYRQRESATEKSITDNMFKKKVHFFQHLEIAEGLKLLANKNPELEYMFLWVSVRIIGIPVRTFLTENSMDTNDKELFYQRVKELFKDREVKYTYGIGNKVSSAAVQNILSLLESNNKLDLPRNKLDSKVIFTANTTSENWHMLQGFNILERSKVTFFRKTRKLLAHPIWFIRDMAIMKLLLGAYRWKQVKTN